MALAAGTKIGPYEVLSPLGAGGMGEVYRARDTKLGRDVALKVLPEAFERDTERMARFGREAKVLASLNHPNIASIYGLEDSGDVYALVMELIEGPTLGDRIRSGAIPMDEVLPIARQIAEGLEYAHERGIVHRDLKPANIKLAENDTVKILDFGLAKAIEGGAASVDMSTSPTISRMATAAGLLLGTAAYMSPEQAKGKPVDRRADIWAFGCVLYEMLTGKKAFGGETITDTLAAVVRAEPDWTALRQGMDVRVRDLLQRCLTKDAKQRLQAIGDARIAVDEIFSGGPQQLSASERPTKKWQQWLGWGVAALLLISLALITFSRFGQKGIPGAPVRFQISPPEQVTVIPGSPFAISPDGRQLAFYAAGSDGVQRLWVRALDSLEARPLLGSESSSFAPLFWSPDSRFIAFDGAGKLKKIDVAGGTAEIVCDVNGVVLGGSWNRDGVIIFGSTGGTLMRVSAGGGTASPITKLDASRHEVQHFLPSFLSDGRHFLYERFSSGSEQIGVYLGSLEAKPGQQSSKRLLDADFWFYYATSPDPTAGQLLFLRDGALMAQRIDDRRLELAGEPTTLEDSSSNVSTFSVSSNGILVYRSGGDRRSQLTWLDRRGKVLGTAGEPGSIVTLALSPDETKAAISRFGNFNPGLWLLDLSRGTSTRFTFDASNSAHAVWSGDGSRVIFASDRHGGIANLYQKPAGGGRDEELLLKSGDDKIPTSWSRDGRFLMYSAKNPKTKADLWVLPLEGDKKPIPFLQTEFNEEDGRFSPDGHWVAYTSDESGRKEIYVREFSLNTGGASTDIGTKWLISTSGGAGPRWRGDGKELYYRTQDGKVLAVEIATNPAFRAGVPKELFRGQAQGLTFSGPQWDVTSDGKRFLVAAFSAAPNPHPFTVVLNWQTTAKK